MNIVADDDADATLFDHISNEFEAELPDDEVDAAKEIARNANGYENETVAQAIQTLAADDEVHEFYGVALYHAENGSDDIRKVLDVRFGESPDRTEYDHRPRVKVYEVPVNGIMVYAGHVMTEAEGEEQGWVSYPLSAAEEDMARIRDTLERQHLPIQIEVKRDDVDVEVPTPEDGQGST